mmetsp:Transcript_74061/g.187832  ORF Transcript_74061/g.187832 Transcript_74061/m.187832 type:complete len:287 (-) Transcript_74061:60-920(-)
MLEISLVVPQNHGPKEALPHGVRELKERSFSLCRLRHRRREPPELVQDRHDHHLHLGPRVGVYHPAAVVVEALAVETEVHDLVRHGLFDVLSDLMQLLLLENETLACVAVQRGQPAEPQGSLDQAKIPVYQIRVLDALRQPLHEHERHEAPEQGLHAQHGQPEGVRLTVRVPDHRNVPVKDACGDRPQASQRHRGQCGDQRQRAEHISAMPEEGQVVFYHSPLLLLVAIPRGGHQLQPLQHPEHQPAGDEDAHIQQHRPAHVGLRNGLDVPCGRGRRRRIEAQHAH